MDPSDIYNLIRTSAYTKSGIDVDWCVEITDDIVYLLFQETRTKIDWHTNFDFLIKPYKNQESTMWVHRGFAKAYKSCNDEIMIAFIKAVKDNPDKTVIISGWSYGGAMAQLAVEDFYFRTGKKANLITFGAPKIAGGIKTRNHLRSCVDSIAMFAHVNDIVTKIPPFYYRLDNIPLGTQSFKGLFHPEVYHCLYGLSDLY